MAELDHSGTACVLLGLSSGSAHPPERDTPRSPVDAKAAASGSAIKSYALLTATKRQTQAAALPRKEWSPHEDELIRRGVEQLGCRWRVIAAQLPGRSDDAVRNRWSRLQDTIKGRAHGRDNVFKRATVGGSADGAGSEEDGGRDGSRGDRGCPGGSVGRSELASGADAVGGAGFMGPESPRTNLPGKMGPSSSARSSTKLASAGGKSPTGSGGGGGGATAGNVSSFRKERSSWTRAEDDIIVQGVAELGHKWFEIARRLPGRTDHAIRNRWSRLQSILLQQDTQQLGSLSQVGAGLSPKLPESAPTLAVSSISGGGLSGISAHGLGASPRFMPSPTCAYAGQDESSLLLNQEHKHSLLRPSQIAEHEQMDSNSPHHLMDHGGTSVEESLLPTAAAELSPPDAPPSGHCAASAIASCHACEAMIAPATVATIDASALETPVPPHIMSMAAVPTPSLLSSIVSPSSTGTENSPVAVRADAPVSTVFQEGALLLAVSNQASFDRGAMTEADRSTTLGFHQASPLSHPLATRSAAPIIALANQTNCSDDSGLQTLAAASPRPIIYLHDHGDVPARPSTDDVSQGPCARPAIEINIAATNDAGAGDTLAPAHERAQCYMSSEATSLRYTPSGGDAVVRDASLRRGESTPERDESASKENESAPTSGVTGREHGAFPPDGAPSDATASSFIGRSMDTLEQQEASMPEGSAELLLLRKRARVTA